MQEKISIFIESLKRDHKTVFKITTYEELKRLGH